MPSGRTSTVEVVGRWLLSEGDVTAIPRMDGKAILSVSRKESRGGREESGR